MNISPISFKGSMSEKYINIDFNKKNAGIPEDMPDSTILEKRYDDGMPYFVTKGQILAEFKRYEACKKALEQLNQTGTAKYIGNPDDYYGSHKYAGCSENI